MAVRQYIGARYTTKIYENSLDPSSAEWEASTAYEPLTLVTYNNSSYLSKREVPNSVGDPASNPTYWVVTGAYNGQIATLQAQVQSINDRLDNEEFYVTPEEYGAVGDGVTDDTQAFEDAFHSGMPVKCKMGKTYLVGVLDLHDMERIFLDGNFCKIVGSQFHVNVNPGGTSWIISYAWRSFIKNTWFVAQGSEVALHLGGGLRMENCTFDDYDTAILFTNNYIDETKVYNTSFRNYGRGDINTARIVHNGLGDQMEIKGCHSTGTYTPKYIFYGSYVQSGVMENNIACGAHFTAASIVDIVACKFSISGVARIDSDSPESTITLRNCHFVGVDRFNSNLKYVDCVFTENTAASGHDGLSISQFENCENCKLWVNRNATGAGGSLYINSDDIKDTVDFNYPISSGDILAGSATVADSDGATGLSQSGTYTYYAIPSMYPDRLVRHATDGFNYSFSVSVTAGQIVYFGTDAQYNKSFRHIYRVNPNGTIDHAVVPPVAQPSGTWRGLILDNGLCNGFAWQSIGSLPTLAASSVSMVNGIVSGADADLPTGALYLDSGVVKQA